MVLISKGPNSGTLSGYQLD